MSTRQEHHPILFIILKNSKNIISLTNFMDKGFKIILKKDTIEIINDNIYII